MNDNMLATAVEHTAPVPAIEKPVEPARKRKKYASRLGFVCPRCSTNLRSCFCSVNEGGFRLIPSYGVCPKCDKVYGLNVVEPETIVKKEEK